MQNREGLIKATAPGDADGGAGDKTLPDPTLLAKIVLVALFASALLVAIVMNALGWTAIPFDPSKNATANFALFAGFYVAAQVLERLLQLVSPLLPWPWWPLPKSMTDPKVKAAQLKADRGYVTLGVAAVLGVAASCGFGLFFLSAIGISAPNTVDSLLTGITIAAGTKPLHDFITLLQNQNAPTTGTTT
jgi:hypothetical protein